MKTIERFIWVFALTVALFLLVGSTSAMAQNLSGAIFTTNFNGTFVNGNVYDHKEDVYLNGGPRPNAPCTAAGLPDGDYYFQVTDPSGAVLLSSDLVTNRMVHVMGGVIVSYSGSHVNGAGKCGSITVALGVDSSGNSLLADTPNPGGEYKVWITQVVNYTPGSGSFGFIPSKSKTDNFKVLVPVCDGCPG